MSESQNEWRNESISFSFPLGASLGVVVARLESKLDEFTIES